MAVNRAALKRLRKRKHPGFQNLVKAGVPPGALANAARHASPAAKKKNPNLNKVKGKSKVDPGVQRAAYARLTQQKKK